MERIFVPFVLELTNILLIYFGFFNYYFEHNNAVAGEKGKGFVQEEIDLISWVHPLSIVCLCVWCFVVIAKLCRIFFVFSLYWETEYCDNKVYGSLSEDGLSQAKPNAWEFAVFLLSSLPLFLIELAIVASRSDAFAIRKTTGVFPRGAWWQTFAVLSLGYSFFRVVHYIGVQTNLLCEAGNNALQSGRGVVNISARASKKFQLENLKTRQQALSTGRDPMYALRDVNVEDGSGYGGSSLDAYDGSGTSTGSGGSSSLTFGRPLSPAQARHKRRKMGGLDNLEMVPRIKPSNRTPQNEGKGQGNISFTKKVDFER